MSPSLWGVVNVTPDSFSNDGFHTDAEAAIAHGRRLAAEGADVLDIGGESTRPGAEPVSVEAEVARVLPVIKGLRGVAPLSIDTTKPAVARAALTAGAFIWNDVAALRGPGALETAAELGCAVVLMHMRGEPRTMQDAPAYDDVTAEVEAFLLARAEAAMSAGIASGKITLDPGLGFGKTAAHNLRLLADLPRLARHGFPILVGASRKRTVAAIDPAAREATDRLGGSLAFALHAAAHGAAALRVHDVRETRQALLVQAALEDAARA